MLFLDHPVPNRPDWTGYNLGTQSKITQPEIDGACNSLIFNFYRSLKMGHVFLRNRSVLKNSLLFDRLLAGVEHACCMQNLPAGSYFYTSN